MSAFANAARSESRKCYTENGATAYSSTGNVLLDLFSSVGAMRNAEDATIETMIAEAYAQYQLLTTKMMFYTRDIRGDRVGKGERHTFRVMLKYMANHHPESVVPNIPLIGVYGRFDDLYALIGTPCESYMWQYMREQFETDVANMEYNLSHPDSEKKKPVSLLCKWLKSIHASSKESRKIAASTYKHLGLHSEREYRQVVSKLRAYIPVLERQMSDGNWQNIDFERVPAMAMKTYRNAFTRHDVGNFTEYKAAVAKGEAKINASTLFPYDIVGSYMDLLDRCRNTVLFDEILEAQWKAMPDYLGKPVNILVMCDTSGSMKDPVNGVYALPLKAAVGLSIYFAEHNTGAFHNLFMAFSDDAEFVEMHGETLSQKICSVRKAPWDMDTNLERAFMRVLRMAIDNHIPQNEMPTSIVVISDMQINACTDTDWSFYHSMKKRFADEGYELPRIIFWNVNAKNPTMLVDDKTRDGVQLISGLNAKTFAEIIDNCTASSLELMYNCLNNPRYDAVTVLS